MDGSRSRRYGTAAGLRNRGAPVLRIGTPTPVLRGNVVLPDRILKGAAVVCRGGRIESVSRTRRSSAGIVDAGDGWIVPGYIDIHVHGGDGADYMDGTIDAVKTAN